MRWSKKGVITVMVLVSLFIMGCSGGGGSSTGGSSDTIKIGLIAPMTGSESLYGQAYQRGVELAIKDINNAGGILGKKVQLLVEDDQNDPNQSINAVQKLVTQNHVVGIIGSFSSKCSIPAHEQACSLKVPIISPTSTNPSVTTNNDGTHKWCAFRATFIDPFQGEVGAKFAYQNINIRKAAVFWDNGNDYSIGLGQAFITNFEKLGGQVPIKEAYTSSDQDFSAQITKAIQAGVELIYLPDYYSKVNLISGQARKLGYKGIFMGGDGWDDPALDKTVLSGSYFTTHYSPDDPGSASLVSEWKAAYNGETPSGIGALAYDAAVILLKGGIEKAGTTDGEKVADAMVHITDLKVGTGTISINSLGNTVKPAYVMQVTSGEPKFITKVGP